MPDKWWQLLSFQFEKKVHWTLYISVFLLMLFICRWLSTLFVFLLKLSSVSTRRKFPATVYSSHVVSPSPGSWVASSQLCPGCFAFLLFHEPSLMTHGMAHVWTTYLGTPEKNQGEREVRKSDKNKEKVGVGRKWCKEKKEQKSYFLLICFVFLCQFIN